MKAFTPARVSAFQIISAANQIDSEPRRMSVSL